jgi:predicted anti-sigma-YlaC factor YlaD
MNGHVFEWLDAYYDDELHGSRLRQVEAHLAQCLECQGYLQQLQSLSAMLQESPAPAPGISTERFVAQVGLRLPRQQQRLPGAGLIRQAWRWSPVMLFVAWVFVQAVLWVTDLGLPLLNLAHVDTGWLFPSQGGLDFSAWLPVGVTVCFGVLYLCWFAAWWAIRDNHTLSQAESR